MYREIKTNWIQNKRKENRKKWKTNEKGKKKQTGARNKEINDEKEWEKAIWRRKEDECFFYGSKSLSIEIIRFCHQETTFVNEWVAI